MKDTKTVEIAKKHREDVIDTLQLRLKERRVFYALLIIFLLTVTYENSAFIYSQLLGGSHPTPELSARRKPQLKHDMLKRLDRALADASEDFPQYWARFAGNQKLLTEAGQLLAEEGDGSESLAKVSAVVASMNEFAAHPIIKSTKNLEKLLGEITSLQRILRLKGDEVAIMPRPLEFTRETGVGSDQRLRNLFQYGIR